jgi:hypothetical protein
LTAAAHVPSDVESYLTRVREALADVPLDERNDLLSEVEASLYDTASETGGSVAARLGPPEEFAAELRAAAGLHAPSPAPPPSLLATLRDVSRDARVRATLATGRELAPVWWVARGYVAVAALALAVGASWSVAHASVPRLGSAATGLTLIAVAVVVSVAAGIWSRRRATVPPRALILLNLVLLTAAIPVAQHLAKGRPATPAIQTVVQVEPLPGLAYNGTPLRNVYPFSRDGRSLRDVFLYTDSGAPIDVKSSFDPNRRVLRTRSGKPVFNAYPIRYYDPGTKRVSRPGAGPPVKVPRLATPPLRGSKRR